MNVDYRLPGSANCSTVPAGLASSYARDIPCVEAGTPTVSSCVVRLVAIGMVDDPLGNACGARSHDDAIGQKLGCLVVRHMRI
jgi:hypothetical protein